MRWDDDWFEIEKDAKREVVVCAEAVLGV